MKTVHVCFLHFGKALNLDDDDNNNDNIPSNLIDIKTYTEMRNVIRESILEQNKYLNLHRNINSSNIIYVYLQDT